MSTGASECPICFEVFPDEIFLCQSGHSICGACCKLIVLCPLCQKAMSDVRNFALQSIIAEMQISDENCPICRTEAPTSSAEQLLAHLVNHKKKFVNCAKPYTYEKSFKKTANKQDFLVMMWNKEFFKFSISVTKSFVYFALQTCSELVTKQYVLEVSTNQGRQYVGKVCIGAQQRVSFTDSIAIPKADFLKPNAKALEVKVQCSIREYVNMRRSRRRSKL